MGFGVQKKDLESLVLDSVCVECGFISWGGGGDICIFLFYCVFVVFIKQRIKD